MIAETFDNITAWLKDNAPKILEQSLQSGATEAQLNELESVIGIKLPEDFKELYKLHNGLSDDENVGSLFYGMKFYPIDSIIVDHEQNASLPVTALLKWDPAIDQSNLFNPGWITFAFDGAHTSLKMDLVPTEEGNYGQIIFIDDEYEVGILVAASITELLVTFASDLKSGLYHLAEDALEEGDEFLSPDDSIDIVNWYQSDQWKHLQE